MSSDINRRASACDFIWMFFSCRVFVVVLNSLLPTLLPGKLREFYVQGTGMETDLKEKLK